MTIPKVYIVIVNYNGFEDTIESLESIFRNTYGNYHVVVVDNGSSDDSVNHIIKWAENSFCVFVSKNNSLVGYSHPPIDKPLNLIHLTEDNVFNSEKKDPHARLSIISLKSNAGFAAGNNVGIKYATIFQDAAYVWILNNDTVISNDALGKLVSFTESQKKINSKLGIVASKLKFYKRPYHLQAVGAVFNKWTASNYQIGLGEIDKKQYDDRELKFDYVVGASMFVGINFIEEVGLMCEDYFLYFEELDWCTRGKKLGWEFDYCKDSIVYHKLGVSTGQNDKFNNFYTSNEYAIKSLFLFYRKFYPGLTFIPRLRLIYTALKLLLKGNSDGFGYIVKRVL